MSETIIYNPSKTIDLSFVKQVNILDTALVNINGSVKEGKIKLISIRGVNINLGYGDRFHKWCHVIAIKKQTCGLKKYVVVFYNPTACQTQIFKVEAKNEFRAGREFYRKYKRKGLIETIYEV